jgi:polyhydroxyalkanoate synthesis regulator protein
MGSAVGKKTGQFLHGMVSFYGNVMKSAVNKVKEARAEKTSDSGYG